MRRYLLRTCTFERQIRQQQYNKNHSSTPVVGVGGRSIELYQRERHKYQFGLPIFQFNGLIEKGGQDIT